MQEEMILEFYNMSLKRIPLQVLEGHLPRPEWTTCLRQPILSHFLFRYLHGWTNPDCNCGAAGLAVSRSFGDLDFKEPDECVPSWDG
jgi:hypothetical protein